MDNQTEILRTYPTLPLLQASPVWKEMRIRDRIGIINAYKLKQEMGNQNAEQTNDTVVDNENRDKNLDERHSDRISNIPEQPNTEHNKQTEVQTRSNETFSLNISLNDSQLAAVNLAKQGKSFVLTGAAGSGKTTTERELMKALISAGYLPKDIAAGAFTRVATGNTRKAIFKDPELKELLRGRIHTLHKHLEFAPEYYTDLETGKNKMRFIEQRNESNPFSFRILIIDEAPMCDLLLYQKLYAAMREGTVVIFIGDINQLPPVFGKSIFNYALHQLPVIELNKIYRQADDSGVLQNAWRILDGQVPIKNKDTDIIWWDEAKTKKMGQGRAAMTLGKKNGFFHKKFLKGEYDPLTDIILSPWNKQEMGTDAINAWIAQFLGDERKAIVHEVLAGRNKVYLAIGDLILVDKQLCKITNIEANPGYAGKAPKMASQNLLRIGHYRAVDSKDDNGEIDENEMVGYADINVDEIADDERKNQASAIVSYVYADITPEDKDPDEAIVEYQLQTAGDFAPNGFSLGYATTCHKAQGSEWRKVFILLHEDHSTKGNFVSREWIYTATTRAREKLVYIAKPEILEKAVNNQIIRGKNLEEKIQHINAKASQLGDINDYPVIKKGEWESFDDENNEPEVIKENVRVSIANTLSKTINRFSDLSQYVPMALKAECQRVLKAKWEQAKLVWGDTIGDCPTISYDCQKGSIIGLAHPAKHHIKLNPVYLAAAGLDIRNHIINHTIPHEVCHLVTARYVNMTGHGKDWEMAMRLMQEKPNQYWDGPTLPDWKALAKELLGNMDAVIEDDNLIDGEEE